MVSLVGAAEHGTKIADRASGESNGKGGTVIRYLGNTFYKTSDLDKIVEPDLGSLQGAEYSKSAIDDAAFLIESSYRQQGFIRARVDYRYDRSTTPARVDFLITEGKRVMVSSMTVSGNRFFDTDRLLALDPDIGGSLKRGGPFPLVEERLADLADAIRSLYISNGFVDSRVSKPEIAFSADGSLADVVYRVSEGVRFSIGKVVFNGKWDGEIAQALKKLAEGFAHQIYYPRQRLLLQSQVIEIFEQQGYPQVRVEVEAAKDTETATVELRAKVAPGERVKVGKITIEGNRKTDKAFIESRLLLKSGDLYSLDRRRRSFQNLYLTGLFSSVTITLAKAGSEPKENGKRDVVIRVEERLTRELYLEPGWGSYELFRLAAGYKDRNFFGSGRIFRFDSTFSVKGRSLEFGFTDPWFLGTGVSADFPVNYLYMKEPAFTQEKTAMGVMFTKNFKKNTSLTAGYKLSRNSLTDVGPYTDLQSIDTNYSTGIVSLQLVRDSRNDIFFPTRGYRGFVAAEIAASPLGSEIDFYKLTFGVRYFYPLPGEVVLGMRYATGFILPLGGQVGIPLGERFFNGGENSVRSFREARLGPLDQSGDALGGTAYNIVSMELRRKIAGNFAGSFFIDLGNIAPNGYAADGSIPLVADAGTLSRATFRDYLRDLRAGIGAGLQYLLPVGPARLDFAVNPYPDKSRGEEDYSIHFSIGMAF